MIDYATMVFNKITIVSGLALIAIAIVAVVITVNFFEQANSRYDGYKDAWGHFKVPLLLVYGVLLLDLLVFLFVPTY